MLPSLPFIRHGGIFPPIGVVRDVMLHAVMAVSLGSCVLQMRRVLLRERLAMRLQQLSGVVLGAFRGLVVSGATLTCDMLSERTLGLCNVLQSSAGPVGIRAYAL